MSCGSSTKSGATSIQGVLFGRGWPATRYKTHMVGWIQGRGWPASSGAIRECTHLLGDVHVT